MNRAMNIDEIQALTRLLVYVRDDCGELKHYHEAKQNGEDVSLHIWQQVQPVIGYLLELEKRDCQDCGAHEHLYPCESCGLKHCDKCLRFVEWLQGRPYLCRQCHRKKTFEE